MGHSWCCCRLTNRRGKWARRRCGVPAAEVSNEGYLRLLKILTLRAYRFFGFASVAGTEPVLGELGISPEDFAVCVLGKWFTGHLRFTGDDKLLPAFLTKVMTRDMLDALKKRGVKL